MIVCELAASSWHNSEQNVAGISESAALTGPLIPAPFVITTVELFKAADFYSSYWGQNLQSKSFTQASRILSLGFGPLPWISRASASIFFFFFKKAVNTNTQINV